MEKIRTQDKLLESCKIGQAHTDQQQGQSHQDAYYMWTV